MKLKSALLLVVALASTALVAAAQQPSSYVTVGDGGDASENARKNLFVGRQMVPDEVRSVTTARGGSFSTNTVYGVRPDTAWTIVGDERGLSHQAEELAQQLASAKSDSDREKVQGQLVELLEKQFDQRQKRHEGEIKQLEEQIKKLKDLVGKRQENRREIIGARLSQIVKESQGLGW